MLNDKQLNNIVKKERLTDEDVEKLRNYLDYMQGMKKDFEKMPHDVLYSLKKDLKIIIERLKQEYTNITGTIPLSAYRHKQKR
jgi:hypothetical protein